MDLLALADTVSTDSVHSALVDSVLANKPDAPTSVSTELPTQAAIAEAPSTPSAQPQMSQSTASASNASFPNTTNSSSNSTASNSTPSQDQQASTVTTLSNGNRRFTVNGVSFDMVRVPGGTFTMGATIEQGDDALYIEKPAHQVTLSSYSIGETEVTQEMWQAVMGSNPSRFKGSKKPVENVSWDDCQAFIKKLNQLTGEHFRLPTEAEWEFAARGGNRTQNNKYSGSNNISAVAWCGDNLGSTTHEVKGKRPNELGIYDMTGNVWEWCGDWYGEYSSSSQSNPKGPSTGSCRVLRGGSWNATACSCRVSFRGYSTASNSYRSYGLRLAL